MDICLMTSQGDTKVDAALHFVEISKGVNIFIFTPSASTYTTISLTEIKKVMDINGAGDVFNLMNTRMTVGQMSMNDFSYLDRPSGRLHISVLRKLSEAFYAGLPEWNLLSSNARVSQKRKEQFAQRGGEPRE